jgi:type III restriction enzyme
MELKEYQQSALDAFTRWLDALEAAQAQSQTAADALQAAGVPIPDDVGNYPKAAWQNLKAAGGVAATAGEYVSRTDDAGRPIPHVCFKVPTGGGKTLLAAAALERLNRPTGFTLWITPTRAIYQQTRAALRNREHPYRQMLERASGGRVKLLEKETPFTAGDVANYLCVMLLMLPAANWKKGKDFLRMFRDSGRYPSFFPDGDDALADGRLLERHPDLERVSNDGPVKHSLYNVFKMLRPVVALDEAHKAYGAKKKAANEEFVRSVNRLDPQLVIELSATPNRNISNLLVDITGVELKDEEMIKLPVQVASYANVEWQYALGEAHAQLELLGEEAAALQGGEGRYIRPIAVVRVERTGKDRRDGERVHAEDAREYLVQNLGVPPEQVRVKSAENDELGREDLLSEYSPVRWVITKAALAEGWDCPFAYLLVMLDNTQAQTAITQLVGRVMRQPQARRTGRELLDQCYVYCWNTDVGKAVTQVKQGLEAEGMTGLGDDVRWDDNGMDRVVVRRRERFRGWDIFLPLVLHREGDGWRELDYQRHILPGVDLDAIGAPDTQQGSLPDRPRWQAATVDVGDTGPIYHSERELHIDQSLRIAWYARRLADLMPNPWQAARIVQELMEGLREQGQCDADIYDRRSHWAYALREHIFTELDRQCERVFRDKLHNGAIRFDLAAGQPSYQLAECYSLPANEDDPPLTGYGQPMQMSLFKPVFSRHFDSDLERKFARYLDEQKALQWWHRVAARQRGDYYLRGWRGNRVWPDFIAMGGEHGGQPHLLVFETKGAGFVGNSDTEYKRKLLETLQNTFNAGAMTVRDGPAQGTFRLIFNEQEFPQALADLQGTYNA